MDDFLSNRYRHGGTMIRKNKLLLNIYPALLFSLTLTLSGAATAAQCKGETLSACEQRTDCHWIDAHKRKNGVAIKAYCRTKAKPRNTTKKTLPTTDSSAQASENNTTDQPAEDSKTSLDANNSN